MLKLLAASALAIVLSGAGVIAVLPTAEPAEASGHLAYVLPGNGDLCYGWGSFGYPNNPCWHDDESGTYTALDLQYSSNNANRPVYWRHYGADWSNVLSISFTSLSGTNCTGVRAIIATSGAPGDFHFLHIQDDGAIGTNWQDWYSVPGYVEGSRYLGYTLYDQPSGCAFDVGGHLHQSADTGSSSAIYTNWTVGTNYYCCSLYEWWSSTWTHKVIW